MDKQEAALRAAVRLRGVCTTLSSVIHLLEDAHRFDLSVKLDEPLFELLQLHREIVELPRETGVPAPLHDPSDGSGEDVPF